MEFTVDKTVLLDALSKTQGIIDRRTTSQVLSNVLIEALSDGFMRLTCTDYDVMWAGTIPAEVTTAGAVATNGKQFFEAVKNFMGGRVEVVTEDNWVRMKCGGSQANFSTFPHEEFPRLTEEEDLETFDIPKSLIRELIDFTQFSISNDEARPALNGAFFRVTKAADASGLHLTFVSTDGHRLSKVERSLEGANYTQTPAEGIIHKKGISELRRTLDGDSETVSVGFIGNKEIVFRNDGGVLKVRQVDAKYPNYEKVMSTGSEHKISIPRNIFLQGLRLSTSITGSKTSLVKLSFEDGRLMIIGTNPDLGEGKAEAPIEYSGPNVMIGFNSRYLMDITSAIGDENFVMEFSDSGSQALLKSPSDSGTLFVVMPMRV